MGVKDGLEGDFASDYIHNFDKNFPSWFYSMTEEEQEIYEKGYDWGYEHRDEHREKERKAEQEAQKEQEAREKAQKEQEASEQTQKEGEKKKKQKEQEAREEAQEEGEEQKKQREQEARQQRTSESGGVSGGGGTNTGVWGVVALIIAILVFAGIIGQCVLRSFHVSSQDELWTNAQQYLAEHSLAKPEKIYSVDIANKEEKKFTFGIRPLFSPDGKKIAFLRKIFASKDYLLCIADSNGANIQYTGKQMKANGSFCWSSDSRYIVTVCKVFLEKKFFLLLSGVAPNSSSNNVVSSAVPGHILSFAIASDYKVAFVAEKDKEQILYVQQLDRFAPLTKILKGQDLYVNSWSPDGKMLVVHKGRSTIMFSFDSNQKSIQYIDLDRMFISWAPDNSGMFIFSNAGTIMFATNFSAEPSFLALGDYPKWSPDGKKIAFLSKHHREKDSKYPHEKELILCVANLIPNSGFFSNGYDFVAHNVNNFEWSPDSKKIFFSRKGKSKSKS